MASVEDAGILKEGCVAACSMGKMVRGNLSMKCLVADGLLFRVSTYFESS